ncbi:MAG: rane protein [Chitinophagaceae bacterium]|nr:rane protein [Chitinophagaceae bacterium]
MDHSLIFLIVWSSLLLLTGYLVPFVNNQRKARIIAWGIAVVTTVLSVNFTSNDPPLLRMLVITSLQLLSMKGIVMVETYSIKPKLLFVQWIAFAQGWFGMRPTPFESLVSTPRPPIFYFIFKGITRILFGILLLYLAQVCSWLYLSQLLLLVGLSFILHFGILNISTGLWRALGVDVKELFIKPYASRSLKEFWGKRWNMAFSEMTALAIYKPLVGRWGKINAMIVSFLFSGILHELAISFPVKSGYGLPLLYFTLHAALMYLETKSKQVQKITSHPIASHLWVMGWLILPLPILFHKYFILWVAQPLANFILHGISIQ